MSAASNIEWTDATWNPTRGCSMAQGSNSPECGGCYYCYAARQALRHAGPGGAYEGLVKLTPHGPRWTGKVVEGDMEAPLHWRKPRRVFVDSMSDLFHAAVPDEWILRVFRIMGMCPRHTFQILTKHGAESGRMERFLGGLRWRNLGHSPAMGGNHYVRLIPGDHRDGKSYETDVDFLPNVWLGVSCENQATADARIPHLLKTPAAVRFVSLEPMLGPIDIRPWLRDRTVRILDWVILGGESGPGARPFDLAWARDVIAQCRAAGVAVFMKQAGRVVLGPDTYGDGRAAGECVRLKNRKGADLSELPEWARVREWPR